MALFFGSDQAAEKIGTGGRIFLMLHFSFAFGMGLSNLFVNVYFWQINASINQIAVYNLVHFIALPIAFTFAGWISRSRDRLFSLRVGIAIHVLFFGLVLFLQDRTVDYLVPLGVLLGIGAGFFYLAINVLIYDLTDNTSVERFNGLNGFVIGIANMAAPFVGGMLTGLLPDLLGYRIIFSCSILLFCLVLYYSTKLHTRPLSQRFSLQGVLLDKSYRGVLLTSFFMGLRTGSFPFLIGLLVFSARNEVFLGAFGMAAAGINLAASFIGGRLINKNNRRWWTMGSAIVLSAALLPLGVSISILPLAIFGALDSLGNPLFGITFQAKTFRIIDKSKDVNRTEYLVAREIALNIGRIASIALFLLLLPGDKINTGAITSFMRLITPVSLFMWLSIRDSRHSP